MVFLPLVGPLVGLLVGLLVGPLVPSLLLHLSFQFHLVSLQFHLVLFLDLPTQMELQMLHDLTILCLLLIFSLLLLIFVLTNDLIDRKITILLSFLSVLETQNNHFLDLLEFFPVIFLFRSLRLPSVCSMVLTMGHSVLLLLFLIRLLVCTFFLLLFPEGFDLLDFLSTIVVPIRHLSVLHFRFVVVLVL